MFTGSMVALVTPMQQDAAGQAVLDLEALRALIDWHLEAGTDGLVLLGTTGEAPTITGAERVTLIETTVAHLKHRLPLIVGSGTNSTAHSIELTQQAMELGADACLLVTPYYNKPTQSGLLQHFSAIAQAVPIPQILYNVPGRTGCDLANSTVAQLAQQANIVGIKDATGDVSRLPELLALGGKFDCLSGDDATGCEFIQQGGHGVVSVTANVAPHSMQAMVRHAIDKEDAQATTLNQQLDGLHRHLFVESNPIPVKWLLAQMGRMQPTLRLPLTELDAALQADLLAAAKAAGIKL